MTNEQGSTAAKQQREQAQQILEETVDPDAVKVLDWSHLWRKIRDAVRAVQPGKRATRRKWRKE